VRGDETINAGVVAPLVLLFPISPLDQVKNWSLPHRGSNAGTQESDFDDAVVYLNRMSTDFVFILAERPRLR
jgi:hypothetical protein